MSARSTMFLRDTTSSTINVDDRQLTLKPSSAWPQRSRAMCEVTPKSQRPPTAGTPHSSSGGGAANGLTDSPSSAPRPNGMTPGSVVKIQPFITPQKPLSAIHTHTPLRSRYLLKEVEPGAAKPVLTVVLDLDETLVSNRRADLTAAILRPYALHVLNALRHMPNLEVVLWTASTRETGAPVVDQLYEGGEVFDDVIFRSDAWFTEPIHTKDLRLLGRDMDRVVVFDNAPNCCKLNQQNSVLVEDFHGVRSDNDAALVNCYYIIESLLKQANQGISVRDGLARLIKEGHLCRPVYYQLPESWSKASLRDVAPLKVPPHGQYVRAHTLPPNSQTMKHWTM